MADALLKLEPQARYVEKTVGRERCESVAKRSSDSAKKTCIRVRNRLCFTSMRPTVWASGSEYNKRSSPDMGMRLMPLPSTQAKLPNDCITPLGMPMVPKV